MYNKQLGYRGSPAPIRSGAVAGLKCCNPPHPTNGNFQLFSKVKTSDNSIAKFMVKNKIKNSEKMELKIFTSNCQSLANNSRLHQLETICENSNFDVIGLAKTRRFGTELEKRKTETTFLWQQNQRLYRGAGFYIHHKWINKLSLVQVYAPTSADPMTGDKFYILLNETLTKTQGYYEIVMGDLNTKIGRGNTNLCNVGQYGLCQDTNENGERLIKFAEQNILKIANPVFKKRLEKMDLAISR